MSDGQERRVDDGYVWWKCDMCERDKFGMRRGNTLSVKFRERKMTIVGGIISATCTFCATISTLDLDLNGTEDDHPLLETAHALDGE